MTKSGPAAWCLAVILNALALALVLVMVAILVVAALWSRQPDFAVEGAILDSMMYRFQQQPPPESVMMLQEIKLSLNLEASNQNCHSAVVFRALHLNVAIADQNVSELRAEGPFEVRAMGVLPLGTFVATATNVPLGDAATRAVEAVHHTVTLGILGEAKTDRMVAGFIHVRQTTTLSCEIKFSLLYGVAMPFVCRSSTDNLFW